MSDVNLLPEDLRDEEERERKKKEHPLTIPMSTPMVDDHKERRTVGVQGSAQIKTEEDPKLKHVREESYIRVNSSGKIVHETPTAQEPVRRALPWWRRLFSGGVRVEHAPSSRVTPTPSKIIPLHPQPPTAPTPTPVNQKTISTVRESGTAIKQDVSPSPSVAPAKVSSPTMSPSVKPLGRNEPARLNDPLAPPPLGVNLIPTEWSLTPHLSSSLRSRVIVALVALFILSIAGSLAGRMLYTSRQQALLQQLNDQHQKAQAEIASEQPRDQQWLALLNRLNVLDVLLKHHVNVLPAFTVLEQTVIPEVTYTKATVTGAGKIEVEGHTQSRALLAKQVVALRGATPAPDDVEITGVSVDQKSHDLTFDLSIALPVGTLVYASH